MNPEVSVIILNWNGRPLLERFLPSVVASTYENLEIVVADNASTDDSVEWLERNYPSVKIIRHPENWGFCRGYNEAIRQTNSEFVMLLNNDVEVEPGWLEPLIDAMGEDSDLAAVQPKLIDTETRTRFEYAGAAGGHIDRFGFPFARGRIFFTVEEDRGQYDQTADIFWATGAAMMIRRECLAKVGLLDERFEFHMEEIDLCWRMHRAGLGVRAVPKSRVFHQGGSSLPASSPRKTFYNYRNSLLMLHKNIPHRRRTFALRFFFDLAALLRFLVTGDASHASAVIRGYRDFFRLKDVAPRVEADLRPPPSTLHPPSYSGSIVIDYFLRNRKRYSELPRVRFILGK